MGKLQQKVARDMTVMLTAGGAIEDIIELGRSMGVRSVHLDQLSVPVEEESARRNLLTAMKQTKHGLQ